MGSLGQSLPRVHKRREGALGSQNGPQNFRRWSCLGSEKTVSVPWAEALQEKVAWEG